VAVVATLPTVRTRLPHLESYKDGDAIFEALAQVLNFGPVTHVAGNVETPLGFHAVSEEPQAFGRVDVGVILQIRLLYTSVHALCRRCCGRWPEMALMSEPSF
jgi:hypothetical protein